MLIRFILLPFLIFMSFAASAALSTVPLREAWALSTTDTISVNYLTKTANASVYLNAVDGTIYRATATTTSARLLGVAESSLTGGKGNPWLIGVIAAAGLSYEAYKWYKADTTEGLVPFGSCGGSLDLVTLDQCVGKAPAIFHSVFKDNYDLYGNVYIVTDVVPEKIKGVNGDDYYLWVKHIRRQKYSDTAFVDHREQWPVSWVYVEDRPTTAKNKKEITDDEASALLFSALPSADSSRQAFSEGNQPYPLEGLFTNEDLSVDPTYSPQADITTENLPDYITKYNNNTLQTTDPSKPNYVTPAQYEYIKTQAERVAAIAAGGSASTSPLQGMEQPITQKQYDESNKKTDEAAANNIKSADWTGVDTASKGGDGANDALDRMAKGIDPTLPVLLVPDFPTYSSCRTIDLSWKGYSAVFPTQSQCVKMEEFKINFGYFLYLLTAIGIIFELLRRVD